MAERSNAAVLKTVDCNRSGGSNPSLSALLRKWSEFVGNDFCETLIIKLNSQKVTGCPKGVLVSWSLSMGSGTETAQHAFFCRLSSFFLIEHLLNVRKPI